jgi:hypothetical protein
MSHRAAELERQLGVDTVEKLGWRAFLGSTEGFPAKSVLLSN